MTTVAARRHHNVTATVTARQPAARAWAAWCVGLLALLLSTAAWAQDATGTWNVTFKGGVKLVMTLQQNGRNVSGHLATSDGTQGQVSGQLVGNELRLSRDTGVETIQRYQVVMRGDTFSGRFWNEGRYPDEGSFEGQRARAPAPPAAAQVGGDWTVTFQGVNGTVRSTMTLRQSGDGVTGTLATSDGTATQLRGTVVGNELTLARDTGKDTIQNYRVRLAGDRFEGRFWNEGRYPDQGGFVGVRTSPAGAGAGAAAPTTAAAGPINLNGSWRNNLLHVFQEGEQILITASWKQPSGAWVIWRGEGQITGRRFSLPIRYSSMTAAAGGVYQGDFVLSDDGDTLSAQYLQAGRVVDRQVYPRDR